MDTASARHPSQGLADVAEITGGCCFFALNFLPASNIDLFHLPQSRKHSKLAASI